MCMDMGMDMCMSICTDMRVDMCMDMCTDTYMDMSMDMFADMCMSMSTDMCMDMCLARYWSLANHSSKDYLGISHWSITAIKHRRGLAVISDLYTCLHAQLPSVPHTHRANT